MRATVHGRVQGVFFRDSTREEAGRHGIAGWVRNREDGSVEVHAEGSPAAVEALLDFVRGGPPRADVQRVDVEDVDAEDLSGFDVR